MHEFVRCKHERRCSHTRGADVSFRDVTIKIPDGWCDVTHRKCGLRFESVSWDWDLGEARQICALRALNVLGGGSIWKINIEIWYLSPYIEKPLNSKVIKSFVPELRSKCFLCFGIPMLSICALWTLWTFCVPVWICLFHIFISGYVPYNSNLVTDYLTKMGIKTVPRHLYSPDLAPCDFLLFPKLEWNLRSCRYETIEDRKEAVAKVIDTLTQEDFHGAFQKLLERYKCIAAGEDYLKGTRVSCVYYQ